MTNVSPLTEPNACHMDPRQDKIGNTWMLKVHVEWRATEQQLSYFLVCSTSKDVFHVCKQQSGEQ